MAFIKKPLKTTIKDPKYSEQKKTFRYDYSYWSHDETEKFIGQEDVFNDLGRKICEQAWAGFNCSILAYGQTGSGKSYSIVGYQ